MNHPQAQPADDEAEARRQYAAIRAAGGIPALRELMHHLKFSSITVIA